MIRIVLDEDQLKALSEAEESVELVDADGRIVGFADRGFTSDEVAAAAGRVRSEGPWHSTREVLERLESLGSNG